VAGTPAFAEKLVAAADAVTPAVVPKPSPTGWEGMAEAAIEDAPEPPTDIT
jgi:hypothetical protein